MSNTITVTKELKRNMEMANLQQKVDELKVLAEAAIKYNAMNKDMILGDLKRAEEKLAEALKASK